MGTVEEKTIAAWDGTQLRTAVYFPGPPSQSSKVCVLLSGQSEFLEKYGEVTGELNARGFTVASFDWRGQGGSERLLPDKLKGYVRDFAEYDDDLASFIYHIVRPLTDTPPLVLAHSMGGHLALRALHDCPNMFSAVVLAAPMLDIYTRGYPRFIARTVTAINTGLGFGKCYGWGMKSRDPLIVDFARQLCTSDAARFQRTRAILQQRPDLRIAGPAWGWIEAAYRSMQTQAGPGYGEAIKTNVLMFGAGKDRIVKLEACRDFAARLPRARYVEIEDAEHEILMESDSIRARFWEEFDSFTQTL
jgi:Lysophospholipase